MDIVTDGSGLRAGELPDDLNSAEVGMWQAFRNGSVYDLRAGDPLLDDPHGGHPWGPERTVRARIVCWLLLDGPPALDGRVSSLKLTGVQIADLLDLAGGTVEPYLEMKGCRFEKEILLPESRFTTVRLVDCSIPRLEAARLHTEGDLHLPRSRFYHGVRLTDAQIGTDLLLNQTVIHRDRRDNSLVGDGMTVGQDLQAEMMESYGELSLRGARVGVSLSLRGSRLTNPYGRRALNAPQLTVERTVYLTPAGLGDPVLTSGRTPAHGTRIQRFECEGGIRLDDGRFGDAVDFDQARLVLRDDQEISLRRVQVPELRFLGRRPQYGRIVLNGARVVTLVDQASSWPGAGQLQMGGFQYEYLVPRGPFPLARRLQWVAAATPEYNPEPYERLATVLRSSGEDEDAREVLLAKQRHRRENLPVAAKFWGYVQDWTVAYGYRPGRAAVWMTVLWAATSLAFAQSDHPPLKHGEHPPWNPSLFALDLLLPVIDLGHVGFWQLHGGWQWLSAVVILLGWVLATTVAAGATRTLRRT